MARGWESKAIEQQIEEAAADSMIATGESIMSDNIDQVQKREGLKLQRTRILQDMEGARNPRYIKFLQEMLSEIDRQLSEIA
jgi:hypothetical protein